jgi:hypothetical protein
MRLWVGIGLVAMVAGCATTGKSPLQILSVSTVNDKGDAVAGVPCTLHSDKGRWDVTTPGRVEVARSRRPLRVNCENDEWQSASKVDASVVAAVLKVTSEGAAIGTVVGLVGAGGSGAAGGSLVAAAAAGTAMAASIVVMVGAGLLWKLRDDTSRAYPARVVVLSEPGTQLPP